MFCIKVRNRVKQVLQRFDSFIDVHAELALKVTSTLKNILSSPVADIVTALIPGDADDVIREQLLTALEYATNALLAAEECGACAGLEAQLACLTAHVRRCPEDKRDALLQKMASLLTRKLDGSRMKQNLYDLFVQAKYAMTKEEE
jgi:hypothetical protein